NNLSYGFGNAKDKEQLGRQRAANAANAANMDVSSDGVAALAERNSAAPATRAPSNAPASGVTKTGAGTLTLNGSNTFGGNDYWDISTPDQSKRTTTEYFSQL